MGMMINQLVQAEDQMNGTPCLGCMTKGLEIAALEKENAELKAQQQLAHTMDLAIEHIARIERNPDGIDRG